MQRQIEYVLRTVEERDIRFIRLWFTDVLGLLKSFAITPAELEGAFDEGVVFDGSSIEGFARVQESDMVARPDPSTFQILPAGPADGYLEARMFCDIAMPDGASFAGDPRWALRRMLEKAGSLGYTFYVHPEMEFFLFKSSKAPEPLDTGSYFDLTPLDSAQDFRRDAINRLEAMGISVEYSHHEVAASQHEIDLRFADALTMADNIMTYRLIVKEVAQQKGMHATFMPKPLQGQWGSGMHTHVSLFEGEKNAFFEPSQGLSKVGRQFVAGLLDHAREITAVLNQWVNSYKRLVPGYEAPVHVCWSRHVRSAFVRVPGAKPKKASSARVEIRSPDPACNPYLAFAVVLAAGLDGIERKLDLPDEVTDDVDALSPDERAKRSIVALPEDLLEALHEMERSELVAEALGEHIFERFLRNKRQEWDEYKAYVSPFELERYLPVL